MFLIIKTKQQILILADLIALNNYIIDFSKFLNTVEL